MIRRPAAPFRLAELSSALGEARRDLDGPDLRPTSVRIEEAPYGSLLLRSSHGSHRCHWQDAEHRRHREGNPLMKTMTCRQLGGPCDFAHRAETADEAIKAQDRHLNEVVAAGDATHGEALKEMKGRWKHPISGMGWYRKAKRDFAALADD